MSAEFKVCIIGGGVTGMVIASTLAKAFAESEEHKESKICLIDKNFSGIKRSVPVALGRLGLPSALHELQAHHEKLYLQAAKDNAKLDYGFVRSGQLLLAPTINHADQAAQILATAAYEEPPVFLETSEKITARFEHIPEVNSLFGVFVRQNGYIHTRTLQDSLRHQLNQMGVIVWGSDQVTEIMATDGSVVGVKTKDEEVIADHTIVCSGMGTTHIQQSIGVKMPLRPARMHVFELSSKETLFSPLVTIPEKDSTLYMRPMKSGKYLCASTSEMAPEQATDSHHVDSEEVKRVESLIKETLPTLKHSESSGMGVKTLAITPDRLPYLGRLPSVSGLYVALGFEAQSYNLCFAVGDVLKDLILDKETACDLTAFNPERFNKAE